jgi:hypothetical protein
MWALGLAAVAACSDAGGVDPDAIDQAELAAVRYTLREALADDELYTSLLSLVFPFIDRASHLAEPQGGPTRLVGIELDIDVQDGEGETIDAEFTVVLAWKGFDPATRTVDSVFFVAGAGSAPVDASLGASFSPDAPGTGTAIVMHQEPDSTVTAWQTGTGQLVTSTSSYGQPITQSGGGLTLSVSRGTLSGNFAVTAADEVPGGLTTVMTAKSFAGGARAMLVEISGTFSF